MKQILNQSNYYFTHMYVCMVCMIVVVISNMSEKIFGSIRWYQNKLGCVILLIFSLIAQKEKIIFTYSFKIKT